MTRPLLEIEDLSKTFWLGTRKVEAVSELSLDVMRGECLALVGESGSGKSTIANLILGVLPPTSGEIRLEGEPLPSKRKLRHRRKIQLVQQNPLSSLNPKRAIGSSLRLALDVHNIGNPDSRQNRVAELLQEVGLAPELAKRSPASLSGGQRQRVAIARALACNSELVVLDEPTSALDVIVQSRVLRLLNGLGTKFDLTYVFITHDLAVVRNVANRVAVLNNGRLVELGMTEDLFVNPRHSCTRSLIAAAPVVSDAEHELREMLRMGVE